MPPNIMQAVRQPKCGNKTKLATRTKIAHRAKNCGAAAVSRKCETDRQAAFVGKPFRHHRSNSGVAKTIADPAQHTVAEEKIVKARSIGAQKKSQTNQGSTSDGHPERSESILQTPRDK